MYIVTGGAGFIGANIVAGLNQRGERDVLVVDNLKNSSKFINLRDLFFADYLDKSVFREQLLQGKFERQPITAIFHQGACSDTMEYDGRYMMDNNFAWSRDLFQFAIARRIPLIYASSAATYGDSLCFTEAPANERPLNVYGYSKLLFDRYVQRHYQQLESTVVGLRYFNVYGPRERYHKGRMASMCYQLYRQLRDTGVAKLFGGSGGYGDGEQRRDFIYVRDLVQLNLFLAEPRAQPLYGVFNAGTGQSRSFNDIASTLITILGQGKVEYLPMPESLRDKYQSFTEADMSQLRQQTGYDQPFTSLEEGLRDYVRQLLEQES
ncbi:MAG: ADP-glyceromanno-heptose 6-epimerase [Magnetococcales bacterium]|nr:ADP-glyceromanno-heptose 6-epimerase [Magnetococcales bacterium]